MAITQILRGDSSGAVKAIQDLNKAIDQTEKGYQESTKEARQLERAARRVAEQADPQRKYNRQVEELSKLVRTGRVELSDAEKVAAKYGQRLENAGRAGDRAFGAQALAGVRSIALQYVSVAQALNAVVQGFRDVAAERERAQQAALEARAGVGELSQLAATAEDPAQAFRDLVAEARAARASGAAETQQEAANQLFSLVSAGLDRRDRDFAFQLRAAGTLGNVGGAATAFAALQTALGRQEVGSFEDFISKALRASSIAPALANEIPQAAARSGASARALGIGDEFLNAAVAVLGKQAGSAAEGGTQLASFLKQVEKAIPENPELAGRTGIDLVRYIGSLSEEAQGFGGVLGDRAEAIKGFRTLRDNLKLLTDLTQDIDRADDLGLARKALALPSTDVQQAAALARARSEGRLEVSLGGQAALSNLVSAALAEQERTALAERDSVLTRAALGVGRAQVRVEQFFGNPDYERSVLESLVARGAIRDPELLQEISRALNEQTTVLKQISDQQRVPVTSGRQE